MRIALASCSARPPQFSDFDLLTEALVRAGAQPEEVVWDDASADWNAYDLVAVRFTWDYPLRNDEFVAWAERVGERLHNSPATIAWNSDKHYLADLAAAGIPVVATEYIAPGEPLPDIDREVVVKPTISGAARDTGRFGPGEADTARELITRIHDKGATAMVQPFHASVETVGETAIATVDGEISHVLRKGAVLRPDEIAPIRDDEIAAAEAMYDPGLVTPGTATDEELDLASRVVTVVAERTGAVPLYARVDLIEDSAGEPTLLELEAIEPAYYHELAPGSADRLARAIVDRARPRTYEPPQRAL